MRRGAGCGAWTSPTAAISDRHYTYKLDFLDALVSSLREGTEPTVVVGDFNIIPTDADVWDRSFFDGKTHVLAGNVPRTARHRRRNGRGHRGLSGTYSDLDYQAMRFQRNQGIRIDLQFSRGMTAGRAWTDADERKGKGASDHAPVIVDYTA